MKFYSGALLLATVLTSPYTYSWSNVVSGFYAITAKATDNLGAVTTSGTSNITVTAPPTVSITAPTGNPTQYYQAPASISITATASSVTSTIANVKFYANGNLLGTTTTSPYGFNWNNVPYNATYVALTAVATDANSLQGTSATVNCMVGTLPATGLALWVKGDVGTSLDGSNDILTWYDLSGCGTNLTPSRRRRGPGRQRLQRLARRPLQRQHLELHQRAQSPTVGHLQRLLPGAVHHRAGEHLHQ